jgi:hypothetical protein
MLESTELVTINISEGSSATVTSKCYHVKNIFLMLFVENKTRILVFTEKSDYIGLPWAHLKKKDKSIFDRLKKEFLKETGHDMPQLNINNVYVYRGDTAIYVASTDEEIKTDLGTKAKSKIKAMHMPDICLARISVERNMPFEFKDVVKNLVALVLNELTMTDFYTVPNDP